jgi:acetyl-CoA carboxylase carboxyltransferase component
VASLKKEGKEITPEAEKALLDKIINRYDAQTSPYYAAARLWVDAIIDPVDTRMVISEGIAAANNNPEVRELKTGVFQV